MIWSPATEFGMAGRGWGAGAHPYARLPGRAEGMVPAAVWDLSRQSAGLWVDFRTDAGTLHARTVLSLEPPPEHHYIKYLDLYGRDERGRWRWAGVSRYGFMPSGETPLIEGLPSGWRDWRLYLPLTYRIERLELGVPEGASIVPAPRDFRPPVVVYGTSIVHGCGHVSRPGMVWPSIAGRRLDWPVVNLGFSGSARMEPELAPFLAELDPAVFVIDPLANMSKALVETHAETFLRTLLQAHPKTPVLMMEDRPHAHAWLLPNYGPARQAKLAAWRALAAKLRAEGYPIHELPGDRLLGEDAEATTDGSHPSDLGAMRYADAVVPVLASLLSEPRTLNPPSGT
jgi:lysophospholipase L1-like esterase